MADEPKSYASVADLEARWRALSADEAVKAGALLSDAALVVDAEYARWRQDPAEADPAVLRAVTCQMVARAMGTDPALFGAGQGSMSLGDYSRSLTFSGSTAGDLYMTRQERTLLGLGSRRVSSVRPMSHREDR